MFFDVSKLAQNKGNYAENYLQTKEVYVYL